MLLLKSILKKRLWPVLITTILVIYQLVRIIAFVNVYGGLEHDGGWMLSISRSVAERGAYTTMVSTIVDPTVPGGINVDQKFDIQVDDGRIWFFSGNGIGPASILPDALVLKIFGTDFWALRAGPLAFYTLFLLLAAYILYQLAGLGAIVLFHAFLFFYPHISIFLGYEAMGEVPSMFYVLWAYLVFAWASNDKRPRTKDETSTTSVRRWPLIKGRGLAFLGAGLVGGLALLAKLITLLSLSGVFIWAAVLWLWGVIRPRQTGGSARRKTTTVRFGDLTLLGSGALLLLALWELVHLVILTRLAGFELYLRQAQQRLQFILDDGSGIGLQIHSGPEFFWDKFFLLSEVTHPQRWVVAIIFAAIFGGGLALIRFWANRPEKQNLLAPMWLSWLANTIWFVGLAKTGWPRHFWFGLVLAVMLLSVIVIALIRGGMDEHCVGLARLGKDRHIAWLPFGVGLLLLVLIGWGFLSQPHVRSFFLPDEIVAYWQQKQISNKYDSSLPWIIIPRVAQAEVVEYIEQMPPEARVYYPGQHKAAEIPPKTGRLHYPLDRRQYVTPHPDDVVLISPSLISPWKDPIQRRDLLELVERECPRPAIRNDYYMICPVKDNLLSQ